MRFPVGKDDASFFGNSILAVLMVGGLWFAGHAIMTSIKTHATFVPTQVAAANK